MRTKLISILIISLFIGGCITAPAHGQITKEKELSEVEEFSIQAGTLIQKTFLDVGKVKKVEVQIVIFRNLINQESMSGVRFSKTHVSSYSSDEKIAFLDPDEVDGLIKSIKILESKIFNSKPMNYSEVSFKSRGGFEAGCFYSKESWKTYLKLEKYDNDSYVYLSQNDFSTLLTILIKAQNKL